MRIYKNEVLNALKKINSFITEGGVSPILSNTLFTFDPAKQQLILFATDFDNFYFNRLKVDNLENPLTIMINTKIITNILNAFPDNEIVVEINPENHQITLKANGAELTIAYMDADEYPTFKFNEENKKTVFKTDDKNIFCEALQSVVYCAAKDNTKPVFTGVHINVKADSVTIETTNGKALARAQYKHEQNTTGEYLIRPAFLSKIPEKTAVELITDGEKIGFKLADEEFYTRLIEGRFPDADQIIPKDKKVTMNGEITRMICYFKMIECVAKDSDYTINFDIKNGLVISTKKATKNGTGKVNCKGVTSEGELLISFNLTYFKNILTALKNEKFAAEFTTAQGPVKIYDKFNDVEYYHILMPVRPGFTV